MSTAAVAVRRGSRLRAKYLVFGFVGLMILYVLGHNEYFLIDWKAKVWSTISLSGGGYCRMEWRARALSCWVQCSFRPDCGRDTPNYIGSWDESILQEHW
jgi:hypothetical protein